MIIKSVQWNIGGGYIRDKNADPLHSSSYTNSDTKYISHQLQLLAPDVVTLQEVHSDKMVNQAELIAKDLGMSYFVSDFLSSSHLEQGQLLGQAILSKFPLHRHELKLFINPKFEATFKDGVTKMQSHHKGVTSCTILIEGVEVTIKSLQLLPFDPFKVDPFSEKAAPVFKDVEQKLQDDAPVMLIQGDLNLGSRIPPIKALMPDIIDDRTFELAQTDPTIPNGEKPDRIIYRGLQPVHVTVIKDTLTDHYPVVAAFRFAS